MSRRGDWHRALEEAVRKVGTPLPAETQRFIAQLQIEWELVLAEAERDESMIGRLDE